MTCHATDRSSTACLLLSITDLGSHAGTQFRILLVDTPGLIRCSFLALQVHKAIIRVNGKPRSVVVKVRHPQVAERLSQDFKLLIPLAGFTSQVSTRLASSLPSSSLCSLGHSCRAMNRYTIAVHISMPSAGSAHAAMMAQADAHSMARAARLATYDTGLHHDSTMS